MDMIYRQRHTAPHCSLLSLAPMTRPERYKRMQTVGSSGVSYDDIHV